MINTPQNSYGINWHDTNEPYDTEKFHQYTWDACALGNIFLLNVFVDISDTSRDYWKRQILENEILERMRTNSL